MDKDFGQLKTDHRPDLVYKNIENRKHEKLNAKSM